MPSGRSDVGFFYKNAVPKRHALVQATAHTHGVLLCLEQAGQGLAGVEQGAAVWIRAGRG